MNKTTSCFAVIAVMDTLIILKAELSIASVDCYCCFAMRWYVLERNTSKVPIARIN